MTRAFWPSVLVLAALAPVGRAHDYWIQPDTFCPPVGKPVAVRVFVGDHFKSEGERPFQQKPTVAFRLVSSRKTIDLTTEAKEGKTLMTEIVCPERGNYWIALERAPVAITLAADKFNRSLGDEGLKPILEERRKTKEDG